MSDQQLSHLSIQDVKVPISSTVAGADHDPTADTVQLAFTGVGSDPVAGDWKTASWETIDGVYHAVALVGPSPGVIELSEGYYDVWVKVTDDPETPVLLAGRIEVI